MRTVHTTLLVLFAACLSACNGQGNSSSSDAQADAVSAQVHELRKAIAKLELEATFLKFRVEALESGAANPSTEEQGYDIARTKFGPFTVSTRGVTPYLDGFKIRLRVGNLTNADFNGAKLNLGWGPPYEGQKYDEWEKAQKKRQVSVTNRFASGSFTDIEVILTPAKPEEVKSISVGFELDQLQLRVR